MSEIQTSSQDEKIANVSGFTPEEVAIIKATVAKNTTNLELAYFLNVCKTVNLNPFNKEIWCYKNSQGALLIFPGRDGFLAIAQRNPFYNGIRSCEICQNDEWEINIPAGEIYHKITTVGNERGQMLGAYAIAFRKNGEPTIEFVEFSTYNKGWNTWKTHPAEMIKKVAESHALKKAFGISGLQCEEDFIIKDNIAVPIMTGGQLAGVDETKLEKNISAKKEAGK